MKLGVLGGAFNPVHVGHLLAAREAREVLGLDKVLLVPCARPALKSIRLWTGSRRLKLLKLALRGQEGLEADGLELERGGTSYTVDTLRHLKARPGVSKLTFLMGSDAFRGLPSWREPDALRTLADLVVMRRPGSGPGWTVRRAGGCSSGTGPGSWTSRPGTCRPAKSGAG